MRTVLLLVLIIITCFEASGQNTVLITKNKDAYYEEFSVLASDKKVKHGPYFKLSKPLFGGHAFEAIGNYADGKQHGYWEVFFKDNNNIKEKGFFKNGLKDSLWVYYFPEGVLLRLEEVQSEQGTELQVSGANPVISKKGEYKNGQAIGVWEFFDRYGEVLQRYDYDKKALQYDRSMQSLDNIGAGFIGGDYHLQEELYGNFDFNGLMNSINSKLGMESGRLVLRFAVDANGGISQITEVENSIKNKKITARAFESLEKLNNKWHPQIINGSPQTTYKTISFDLGVKTENSSFMNDKWAFSNVSKGFNFVIKIED